MPPLPEPAPASLSKGAFWLMLRQVALVAAGVDILLLLIFLGLGMPAMAWPNILSALTYAAAYVLLGKRRNTIAVLLMWAEVLLHAGICTVLLGWDSGVHYFLMVFIPAVAVSRSEWHAMGALGILLMIYLGVDAMAARFPPVYTLSPGAALVLRWTSVSTVFVMFGYIGRYYVARVSDVERKLSELATRDPLSGLWNRRQVNLAGDHELQRAIRLGSSLVVLMADIDHFKRVNDERGHAAGDEAIKHIAALMIRSLRSSDILGRWGGEEFIALLPSTSLEEAASIAERLRAMVETSRLDIDGEPLCLTVSIGVQPVDVRRPLSSALAGADAALYAAKARGRNAVVLAPGAA